MEQTATIEETPQVQQTVEITPLNKKLQIVASVLVEANASLGRLMHDAAPDLGTLPTGALALTDTILALAANINRNASTAEAHVGEL